MMNSEKAITIKKFKILFDQLEQAKIDQPSEVHLSLEQDMDLVETMALFNDYQNSELSASFSTVTVG